METNYTDIFTPENAKDARYVLIDMCHKEKIDEKIIGLFMGVNPVVRNDTPLASTSELFVFLWRNPVIQILNLDKYNIRSIEIGEGKSEIGAAAQCFMAKDQEACIKKLKDIHAAFRSAGRMFDGDLIDTDKYIVPKSITDKIKDNKTLIPTVSSVSSNNSKTTTPNNTTAHNRSGAGTEWDGSHKSACGYTGTTYIPKVVTTSWLQRSSKYPIEAAIQRMRTKIEEIKAGTYKSPQLSEIPIDKKEKECGLAEKKAVNQQKLTTPVGAGSGGHTGGYSEYQKRLRAMSGITDETEDEDTLMLGVG
jgi:hypothetical protein